MLTKSNVQITGEAVPGMEEILTPEALEFIEKLHTRFDNRRIELLEKRQVRQKELDSGKKLDFLPETKNIREGDWKIAPLPEDMKDRRVEITGPTNRKMLINALNSGAKMFMADLEDATAPNWFNVIDGQVNLRDAVRRQIDFVIPETGKRYALNEKTAVLMVRPRGWHLPEKNLLIDGKPTSGSLVDFGLYFFHNAKELIDRGTGPYFYLPKLESHQEARLWNEVFIFAQDELGIPQGAIRATVLIETIMAAFEMDEILYELRNHSAGLNCGRWDYIFSVIKRMRNNPDYIFPDRSQVTMTVPFMKAYTSLCIKTCHRRGAPAMGGMAAQIPVKGDDEANTAAFNKVAEDKRREVTNGHDGTWVAHPGMVQTAMEQFDQYMPTPNQIDKQRDDVHVTAEQLVEIPEGSITEQGLRSNISVGIQYIASWLSGNGAAPINNLMEDAATAEISRSQVWQWIRHPKGVLEDGRKVDVSLFHEVIEQEDASIKQAVGDERYNTGHYAEARELFTSLTLQSDFAEFLTLPGYQKLN
ncbi:malate synthase A [Planococcus sp. CP5-4]|uniref:malate synthase A n=1 Tax=unclassified Planococcus (in: firmicutes) TaxID=2662419 RepID=UPI001C2216DA|nr:malate synthase A [Planococcus sp. CP5-4]MBU9673628.1 malate synthase A [Planococcus sp. CP5-4_YE]MBV0907918.1 malate synthase A [Planococcus sp. CP5-4_UN]MBW6063085.1 malate synthase A [Planococcus sp. CP5-4]